MDRTIIIRLAGGLGNQLFQYAAGKALAKRIHAVLKLDLTWYESPPPGVARRLFCLEHFGIRELVASPSEVKRYRGRTLYGRALRKVFRRDVRLRIRRVDSAHAYWDLRRLLRLEGIYLDGYWQNERYFADVRKEIRAIYAAHGESAGQSLELRREIEGSDSIALHVRRGDYAANPALGERFGTCSVAYYEWCLSEAMKGLAHPRVFLFSDDMAWARSSIQLPQDVVVVSPENDAGGLASFDLMRRCRHFIISNSSFSWWAAWLGEAPTTLTFAPTPWFMGGTDDAGIVPDRWIKRNARK